MRIQIVPAGLDIEEQLDGSRVLRMVDVSKVEVAVGPIPADKWAEFVAYINDPASAKARQAAKARLTMPPGVER